jgi:hypothetical protein
VVIFESCTSAAFKQLAPHAVGNCYARRIRSGDAIDEPVRHRQRVPVVRFCPLHWKKPRSLFLTMTSLADLSAELKPFPDYTQLPESGGIFVKNFGEHPQGNLLLTGAERAHRTKQQLEQTEQQPEREQQRADRLAAQLRVLGVEPEG